MFDDYETKPRLDALEIAIQSLLSLDLVFCADARKTCRLNTSEIECAGVPLNSDTGVRGRKQKIKETETKCRPNAEKPRQLQLLRTRTRRTRPRLLLLLPEPPTLQLQHQRPLLVLLLSQQHRASDVPAAPRNATPPPALLFSAQIAATTLRISRRPTSAAKTASLPAGQRTNSSTTSAASRLYRRL